MHEERKTRIVTFLGTGAYQDVTYCFSPEERRVKTRFFAAGICAAYKDTVSEVVSLETDQASASNGAALKNAIKTCSSEVKFTSKRIEAGGGQGLWDDFSTIRRAITDGSPDEVILDVTHGFRSSPVFAGAAVSFIRAVEPSPPIIRMLYGCYERDCNEAEVWDLSPFIDLIDWGFALRSFLATGSAKYLGHLVQESGQKAKDDYRRANNTHEGAPRLDKLGNDFVELGKDLSFLRTPKLIEGDKSSVATVLKTIAETQSAIDGEMPPLSDVLNRIVEILEPLSAEDLAGSSGKDATVALASQFLGWGRMLEASATLREGMVNLHWKKPESNKGSDYNDSRSQAETAAGEHDLFKNICETRNDILHAGFRENPTATKKLEKGLTKQIEKLKEHAPEEQSHAKASDGIFLNISNHPLQHWNEDQKKAASAFAAQLVDLPFPQIPAELDGPGVGRILEGVIREVPPEATHAMVMGEFTASFALVRALQSRGIECLAATSRRMATEIAGGRTICEFEFERFRPYLSQSEVNG